MRNEPAPVPMNVLLEHRDWVGRVARALVGDAAMADDIQQEVWLKAVHSRPTRASAARAWLRTLLRRTARDRWRSEHRRAARERSSARPESVRAVDDLAQHAETLRDVVDAVVALDEPYRSTVLLRFWEDLPPRTVAERQGIPVETVRTRTRRALAQLRAALTKRHGGNGWIAAVVPLSSIPEGASAGAAGTFGSHAATVGGIVMSSKTVATGVIVGAVIGALTGTVVTSWGRTEAPSSVEVADLQAELSALRERVDDVQQKRSAPALMTTPHTAGAASSADQGKRIDALERELQKMRAEAALRAIEGGAARKKVDPKIRPAFADLDTRKLLAAIRKMVSKRSPPIDSEGIVEATDVLLARGLDDDERAEGLIMRGIGLRGTEDTDAERAAFHEARKIAGPDSARGREARIQLAWTDAGDRKHLDSAAGFLEVADHPASNEMQRAWNRYYGAGQFEKAGEHDRARSAYERIVTDHEGSKSLGIRRCVEMAGAALERLTRRN